MGRSVSYPRGAIVAFTVLDVDCDDDWEFDYEWLREDLRERAARGAGCASHAVIRRSAD